MSEKRRLVFDVESIGLHGEGWAVGYALLLGERVIDKSWAWCSPATARGTDEGRKWVAENCPWGEKGLELAVAQEHGLTMGRMLLAPIEVRDWFWEVWLTQRDQGAELWADVPWPVEARFLVECVEDKRGPAKRGRFSLPDTIREMQGPYPLFDVRTYVEAAAGPALEALAREPVLSQEGAEAFMVHHPLSDALLSADRLLKADRALRS